MTEKHKAFTKDLAELLKKHKAELMVEEFDAPTWGPGTFKLVAEFEWEPGDTNADLVLGCFMDFESLEKDLK
jgi:hypothetical protein